MGARGFQVLKRGGREAAKRLQVAASRPGLAATRGVVFPSLNGSSGKQRPLFSGSLFRAGSFKLKYGSIDAADFRLAEAHASLQPSMCGSGPVGSGAVHFFLSLSW